MFIAFGLACLGYGIHLTTTHPEVVYTLGPLGITYYHLCFAVGALSIVRGIWKWVTD